MRIIAITLAIALAACSKQPKPAAQFKQVHEAEADTEEDAAIERPEDDATATMDAEPESEPDIDKPPPDATIETQGTTQDIPPAKDTATTPTGYIIHGHIHASQSRACGGNVCIIGGIQ